MKNNNVYMITGILLVMSLGVVGLAAADVGEDNRYTQNGDTDEWYADMDEMHEYMKQGLGPEEKEIADRVHANCAGR